MILFKQSLVYFNYRFSLPLIPYYLCTFFSDSPICKPNQRIIYGTARKSKTEISCQVDAKPLPINFQWQFKSANGKGVRGNLINNPNIGNGDVIDLIKDMVDLPSNSYTIDNDKSVLTYRAITEADYGYVYCGAENAIGKQEKACRFEVSYLFTSLVYT